MFESRISAGAKESYLVQGNLTQTYLSGPVIWKVMQMKCVERYCELAIKTTQQLYKVTTPCLDDHQFKEEELGSVGELSKVCSQIILKCLYLARIGRPDILWSVNKLARAVTKWTRAWDKRLARLISCIHHTREFKQYCHVGNTAQQSRLGLFQDSDFARDLEDSKSTSGEILCILGSHTFVPISSMCKKNKHLFHTVRRNLRLSLLMQVYAWMGFPLLIFGIWLLKCCILLPTKLRNPKIMCRETCCKTYHQENTPRTKLRLQFSTTIFNCATSIVFPQT